MTSLATKKQIKCSGCLMDSYPTTINQNTKQTAKFHINVGCEQL